MTSPGSQKQCTRIRRSEIKKGIVNNGLASTTRRETPADTADLDADFCMRGAAITTCTDHIHTGPANFTCVFRFERSRAREPLPRKRSYRDANRNGSPDFAKRCPGSRAEAQFGLDRK